MITHEAVSIVGAISTTRVTDIIISAPSVVYVLCVTSIDNGDCVAINDVSVVPLTFICHIVASPARECRLTAKQRLFYLKHSKVCIPYILLHLLQRIRVLVFLGDVAIESGYLMGTTSFDNVFVSGHGRAYSSLTAARVISRASSMLIVSSSSIRIS